MPAIHVERSIIINRPAVEVYDAIVNFNTWTTWSPWLSAENDPQSVVTITNPAAEVGSIYAWDGKYVGAGEIEHAILEPAERIEQKLRFTRPFKSNADVTFLIKPQQQGTKVTWTMESSLPWFLFFMTRMMETYIGMDYERGLKLLKDYVETGSAASQTFTHEELSSKQQRYVVGVRRKDPFDQLSQGMEQCIASATESLTQAGLINSSVGLSSAYLDVCMKTRHFDYNSGYLFDELPDDVPVGLDVTVLQAGNYLQVDHTGAYEHLGNSWNAAYQIARQRKLKMKKSPSYEIYANSPEDVPREELLTVIYLPVK